MATNFEPQSKLLRRMVVSPYKQSSWGTAAALVMGALTYDQRFDGSAVLDLNPTRRSDANMSGKGSHFATNGQVTSWDLKISGVKTEASAWTLGYALAFLLGKETVTGSAAPYTHTMAFDESTRQGVPTTVFMQDSDGLVYFVPDLCITKLTITIPETGAIQLEWDFIGTGFLNEITGAQIATTLATVPAVPTEIYVMGSDCDFQIGPVGAPASILGRNRTSTITLDWQDTVNRGTGTGLYGNFIRKGSPKFSLTSTIAAIATDDIFTRLVGNTQVAFALNAVSDPHAALTVSIPAANLKTAKMGFEDDMVIWNIEADRNHLLPAGRCRAHHLHRHQQPGVVPYGLYRFVVFSCRAFETSARPFLTTMLRERNMGTDRVQSYPLRISPSTRQLAQKLAADEGISLNHFIGLAIAEKIGRMERELELKQPESPAPFSPFAKRF